MSEDTGLQALIKRRHPEYEESLAHWNFMELCYDGGRKWFDGNIFRYHKEGEVEFKDRIARAYRFNHSKEIVDLVGKYIFKSKIFRNTDNAPKEVTDFWSKTNKSGTISIQRFIRQLERMSSVFGRVWVVVDNTSIDSREYGYIVKPQNVLDLSYDDEGNLNWILILETYRDDDDPLESTGEISERFRLWTKNEWFLFKAESVPGSSVDVRVSQIDTGAHNLGIVPVFAADHNDNDSLYSSPALIGDIAYLDRACANYLSNLDAIIQDQTFSQLAMPAQGLMPGEDAHNKMIEAGTKRIFTFDGEGGNHPFYLSPDVKQAELIITAISKIINEIYHTVGMAGERTKQDNSIGIDNSSGVAKAYDFERVNALLATKAVSLKQAEVKIVILVLLWNGIADQYTEEEISSWITYPETFDVRGISDEFSIASNLALIEAPLEMRKEQLRTLVDKLYPRLKEDLKNKMLKEIDDMEDEDFLIGMSSSLMNDKAPPADKIGIKGNNQGENNKEAKVS